MRGHLVLPRGLSACALLLGGWMIIRKLRLQGSEADPMGVRTRNHRDRDKNWLVARRSGSDPSIRDAA